ncbi:MAG: hypothetical protein K2Q32_05745 [Alphaproteobacteria bacterium]|nr:hypothetical protein [Alphaproteobacteria bacterium]
MARHSAKNGAHAIKARKKSYRAKLDKGLHQRLQELVREKNPHFKEFRAAWRGLKNLKRAMDEIEDDKKTQMLLNFVKAAEALMQKYDRGLQDPELRKKREKYKVNMNKVFRIIASEQVQVVWAKSNTIVLDEVIRSTERMSKIATKHELAIADIT